MDSVDSNEISINSNPIEITNVPRSSTSSIPPKLIPPIKPSPKPRPSNKTCSIS